MSQKFHINAKGVPAPCRAKKGNCPYGGESGSENHYDSHEEAAAAIKNENESKFGILAGINSDDKSEPTAEEKADHFYNEHYYPGYDPNAKETGYFKVTSDLDENDPVDKDFIETFGKDVIVTEITSDNPMDYSLDSKSDGAFYTNENLLNSVRDEGYDVSAVFKDEDNYEYTDNFREAYGSYLKSTQGPVKELYGKKFAQVGVVGDGSGGPGDKEFVKSFLDNQKSAQQPEVKVSQEAQKTFEEDVYHSSSSSESFYMLNEDTDPNSEVDQAFTKSFGEGSLVTEIKSDDPMKYSLDSSDDGAYYSHEELFEDVENEGYDTSKVFVDKDDKTYTDDFRKAYGSYLKSRQGPTKELFGKKFAKIVNPASDKGAREFVKTFINTRK